MILISYVRNVKLEHMYQYIECRTENATDPCTPCTATPARAGNPVTESEIEMSDDDGEIDDVYGPAVKPFSGELNVNPWDAILGEVRRSAYRAAWIDERVDLDARRERQLIESGGADFEKISDFELAVRVRASELREWIEQSRKERQHMTKVAADAVRAGLSERYIDSLRAEARMIAQALSKALDAADLDASQRARASEALREALTEMGPMLAARQESMAGTVAVRPEIGR